MNKLPEDERRKLKDVKAKQDAARAMMSEEQIKIFDRAQDPRLEPQQKKGLFEALNLTDEQREALMAVERAKMTDEQLAQFENAKKQLEDAKAKVASMSQEEKDDMMILPNIIRQLGLTGPVIMEYHTLFTRAVNHVHFQTKAQIESRLCHPETCSKLFIAAKGLDEEDLKEIMKFADRHKRKALSEDEYFIALVMIARKQAGLSLAMEDSKDVKLANFRGFKFGGQDPDTDESGEDDDEGDEGDDEEGAPDEDTIADELEKLKTAEKKKLEENTAKLKAKKKAKKAEQKKKSKQSKKEAGAEEEEEVEDDEDLDSLLGKDSDHPCCSPRRILLLILVAVLLGGAALLRYDEDTEFVGLDAGMDEPAESAYEILGVLKTDSEAKIKKQFRKLALQYHPGNLACSTQTNTPSQLCMT
jgi:hypothetical protein